MYYFAYLQNIKFAGFLLMIEEDYPDDPYDEAEMKETLLMGKESEARWRFKNNGSYR